MSWKWIVLSLLWAFGSLALKAQYGNTSNTDSLKDILKQDIDFKTRYQTLKLLSKKENNRIAALNFALTAKNIAIDFKYPYDPEFEINLGGAIPCQQQVFAGQSNI